MTFVTAELSEIDQLIDELNLEALTFALVSGMDDRPKLTATDAHQAIADYRMFLRLIARTEEPVVPTKTIDRVWHLHILDSAHYRDMCNRIYGDYLDHWPYLGVDGGEGELTTLFDLTLNLYYMYFGQSPLGACSNAVAASCSHDGCKGDLLNRRRPSLEENLVALT